MTSDMWLNVLGPKLPEELRRLIYKAHLNSWGEISLLYTRVKLKHAFALDVDIDAEQHEELKGLYSFSGRQIDHHYQMMCHMVMIKLNDKEIHSVREEPYRERYTKLIDEQSGKCSRWVIIDRKTRVNRWDSS